MKHRDVLARLALTAILAVASPAHAIAAEPGDLVELESLEQLRAAFDAAPGVPRLVLLLSPT